MAINAMPSSLLKRLFGRGDPPTGNSEVSTLSSRRTGSSITLVNEDRPHQPSDGKLSDEKKDKTRPKTISKGSLPPERYVRLCPHETLAFERLHHIAHMPGFRGYDKGIDAFTAVPNPYHNVLSSRESFCRLNARLCKPDPEIGVVEGSSNYEHVHMLKLYVNWKINFEAHPHLCESAASIQRFLDTSDVWLCPHRKLSDGRIAQKLFYIMEPSRRPVDPIDRFEANVEIVKKCGYCETEIEVQGEGRICQEKVARILGKGESSKDRRWLAQCY
ncbi:hypothetical protein MMC28_008182 [Mycoblastus sanguinarius]|nr:hypothetical protein [Mycoblastus sanguinarius]